jgi:hypothetical protein
LSPKFHIKKEALSEQEASNVTGVFAVIMVGAYVKHTSVGLEQDVIKPPKHINTIKKNIMFFLG